MSVEDIAAANKLELARGAGQRYLVQRWDDGTICDKTGAPRKIEVQVKSHFCCIVLFGWLIGATLNLCIVPLLHDYAGYIQVSSVFDAAYSPLLSQIKSF